MGKSHLKKGIENWQTWKVLLVTWGAMIIFIVLLFLATSIHNTLFGYVVFGMYILLGLAMVTRAETIGSALLEGSQRMLRFIWCHIFMMHEGNVQKRLDEVESGPLGLTFHILITPLVGLGLMAISIWAIVMLSRGLLLE